MTGSRRGWLLAGVVLALLLGWPGAAQAVPATGGPTESGANAASPSGSQHRKAPGAQGWEWSTPRQVSTADPAEFVALSCGAPTSCLAADRGGFYYRWDGRSWSLASRYGFPTDDVWYVSRWVGKVSCASATFCASVEIYSSDVTPPTGSVVFWDKNRRSAPAMPAGWGARDVSCTSSRNCVALPDDLSVGWARWDGTSWQVRDTSFFDAGDVTCASARLCLARGIFDHSVLRFTGTAWVPETALPPSTVSCSSASLCLAIGSDGVTRRFNGSAWVVAPTPPVGGQLSCASPTHCIDFGTRSYSVYDGRSWSAPVALPPAPVTGLVSCFRASFCAVAQGNRLAQFNGRRWSRVTKVADDPAPLAHVSCATRSSCVGVGTYDAHQFGPAGRVARTELGLAMEPPSIITGVSCVTGTFCVATTSQRMISDVLHMFDGSGWRTVASPDISHYPDAVSCASTRFCVAVGSGEAGSVSDGGETALFDGATWRWFPSPRLTRVSCASQTFCLGTGEADGRSVSSVFNGTTWSTPVPFGDAAGAAPVSVSCATSRYCVAINASGRAATYRNARWSGFAAAPTAGPLVAVSCHGPATCLAVSSTGKVVQNLGAGWSRPRHLRGLTTPVDISCPSATACVVVDDSGQAVFGRFRQVHRWGR